MADKRSVSRKILRKRVRLGKDKDRVLFGHTFNYSPIGLGINTSISLPRNTKVFINIYTDSNKDTFFTARGKVVWTNSVIPGYPSKMGIKFDRPCHELTKMYLDE